MRNTDDHIRRALEIGEQNKRTIELVRNWCANVSVKPLGSGGIVEMNMGLPVGPRMLECPHAPASGMAGADLAFVAIDFYDRNCADCKFRKPVGLPNLKSLVDERDAHQAKQQQAQRRAEQEIADRLVGREAIRQGLRPNLDTLAATTLDQISELDRTRSDDAGARLVQTAELAPETFTPEISEHLFVLIDSKEYWLIEPCLAVLSHLPVDKKKLCQTALGVLHTYSAREAAAKIIEENCESADEAPVCAALPELIRLANPAPSRFGFGPEHVVTFPKPLQEAYRLHAKAIRNGLKEMIELKDSESVRMAARGIVFLSEQDATLLSYLASQLAAKLARSKWLLQGRDEEETELAIHDVRYALTRAFIAKPPETDTIIESYLNGATPEGASELHHVYREVLWKIKHRDEELTITDAHRIAFRRLVAAATQTENEKVANTARQLFRGAPYELTPLAGEEIDLLLGSAAIVAQKLKDFESSNETPRDFLARLDHMNKRRDLSGIENSFIEWACTAAGRYGVASVKKVLSVLNGLPDGSDSLRATIVRHFDKMMISAETLALCLPHYYSALVGSSQVVRARAAETLGKMSRQVLEDLPNLVFEAFSALLADSFLIVHQAAIRALEHFNLPPDFDESARNALRSWINYYAPRSVQDSADAKFLMEMIDLYAHRYATQAAREGRLGDQLIAILKTLRPTDVAHEMRHTGRSFQANPNYGGLLFKLLDDEEAMSIYHEDLIEQIDELPASSLYNERSAAEALGKKVSLRYREMQAVLIEGLSAAGAWKEATEIAKAVFAEIEGTTRTRPIRLRARLRTIACSFEAAIADGKIGVLDRLSSEWKATLTEIERDDEAHKARRDPLKGIRGAN